MLVLIYRQLLAAGAPVMVAIGRADDRDRFPGAEVVDPSMPVELVEGAVLLVDDVGRVPDASPLLTGAIEDRRVRVVLAGDPGGLSGYYGWKAKARSGAAGLLFSPRAGEGELIGTTVGVEETFTAGPGRALLGIRGAKELVQVPWAG